MLQGVAKIELAPPKFSDHVNFQSARRRRRSLPVLTIGSLSIRYHIKQNIAGCKRLVLFSDQQNTGTTRNGLNHDDRGRPISWEYHQNVLGPFERQEAEIGELV